MKREGNEMKATKKHIDQKISRGKTDQARKRNENKQDNDRKTSRKRIEQKKKSTKKQKTIHT